MTPIAISNEAAIGMGRSKGIADQVSLPINVPSARQP